MRTRLLAVATGVVAAAALVAASLAVAGSTLHLTAKDNHKAFSVPMHKAIVITLPSCGDCGYRWTFGYSAVAKLVSHRYVQHSKPPQVGGMGKEIWNFKVIGHKGGDGKIRLRYVSPARKIAKRFAVALRIN